MASRTKERAEVAIEEVIITSEEAASRLILVFSCDKKPGGRRSSFNATWLAWLLSGDLPKNF